MTIDAIGTQAKIATIIDNGGDYILSVKENQDHLFEDLQYLFETDAANHFEQVLHTYAKTVNKGHGRIELRECCAIDHEDYLAYLRGRNQWAGLKTIVQIVSEQHVADKVERETR